MAGLFDPSNIYTQLAAAGLLPQWAARPKSPETGDPGYYPSLNRMFANKDQKDVASHEMTHAAQSNLLEATASLLADKKRKGDISNQESQFLEAYSKLTGKPYSAGSFNSKKEKELAEGQKKVVDALYTNRLKEADKNSSFNKYRTTPNELQAWGVGNMSVPRVGFDPTPSGLQHLDPSFASEFDILLSMYQNLPSNLKQESAQNRQGNIQWGKNWYKEQENMLKNATTYEDVFANPFRPSIK